LTAEPEPKSLNAVRPNEFYCFHHSGRRLRLCDGSAIDLDDQRCRGGFPMPTVIPIGRCRSSPCADGLLSPLQRFFEHTSLLLQQVDGS
jgi:hypothetical protein